MLLEGLFAFLKVFLTAALSLFPTYEPPLESPAFAALSAANIVLPIDTWAMLSGVTVAVMATGLLVWVVMKAVNLIRGSGA
jgi:hypothetical protein